MTRRSIAIDDDEEEVSVEDRQIYSPKSGRRRRRDRGTGREKIDLRECRRDETKVAILVVESQRLGNEEIYPVVAPLVGVVGEVRRAGHWLVVVVARVGDLALREETNRC